VGLAFSIFNAIQAMGMSWIHARTPVFANLVASGKREELNRTFRAAVARSAAFVLLACTGVLVAAWALRAIGSPVAGRIADLGVLACIGTVTVVNTVSVAAQTYMRAHKKEPALAASVVGAVLVSGVAILATPHGVLLTMVLYALVTVGVLLPWTAIVFRRYYR
jgi:Na+-driven multidrug efflux pump